MTTADKSAEFQKIMSRHHKNERERSEQCIGDIIAILGGPDSIEDRENRIIERIISHYSR